MEGDDTDKQTPLIGGRQSAFRQFTSCFVGQTMCLRKLFKCSHVMPASCVVVYFVWLFFANMKRSEIGSVGAAAAPALAPASANDSNGTFVEQMSRADILTETRDIRQLYLGPRHRYCNVDGRWRRIPKDTKPNPPRPYQIPHVIHQIWEREAIPVRFVPWVSSWPKNHPSWEYWLWTPEDVRELIRIDYPGYVRTFDAYERALSRADAARYFILHAFGGLYVDLDVQSLRPIDKLVDGQSCLLTEETLEHAHLLYFRDPPNLITTIMACRPGHALFLVCIRALPYAQRRFPNNDLQSTGPFFLDAVYRRFANRSADVAAVQILSPEYLLPTYDPGQSHRFDQVCAGLTKRSAPYLQATCRRWNDERRLINKPDAKSYTNHFWIHICMKEKYWRTVKAVLIDIILNSKTKPAKAPSSNKRRT